MQGPDRMFQPWDFSMVDVRTFALQGQVMLLVVQMELVLKKQVQPVAGVVATDTWLGVVKIASSPFEVQEAGAKLPSFL